LRYQWEILRELVANINPIPAWDGRGLLPPYLDEAGALSNRSPYRVSLTAMTQRFGNTAARRELLAGLLDFRAALHQAGLMRGFQWVNGSFVTDIMQIANREPRDIDVVTFFHLPDGHTPASFAQEFPEILNRENNRIRYRIDALFMVLDNDDMRYMANRFAYWNNLWSHTREEETSRVQWNGFLELDLSDHEAAVARIALDQTAGS